MKRGAVENCEVATPYGARLLDHFFVRLVACLGDGATALAAGETAGCGAAPVPAATLSDRLVAGALGRGASGGGVEDAGWPRSIDLRLRPPTPLDAACACACACAWA